MVIYLLYSNNKISYNNNNNKVSQTILAIDDISIIVRSQQQNIKDSFITQQNRACIFVSTYDQCQLEQSKEILQMHTNTLKKHRKCLINKYKWILRIRKCMGYLLLLITILPFIIRGTLRFIFIVGLINQKQH